MWEVQGPGSNVQCQELGGHVWGAEMPRPGNEYREDLGGMCDGRADKKAIREAFAAPRRPRKVTDVKDPNSKQATSKGSCYDATGGQFCQRCGAWRGELGLEPTPGLYIEHLVAVFREVRRVLRDDGVCWINMGDSYASGGGGFNKQNAEYLAYQEHSRRAPTPEGLKPKDLVGIPWMLATALRDDRWWLRRDIIWFKTNPMPESCTDRPTTAHEYVFLLTKSGAPLFWTHRDFAGGRKAPLADYRWVGADGTEVDEAPADWLREPARRVKCPVCRGRGRVRATRMTALFGAMEGDWIECGRCAGSRTVQAAEAGVKRNTVLRWERVNLWRGHDYFYDGDAVREGCASGPSDLRKMAEGKARIGGKHKDAQDPLLKANAATNIGRKRAVGNPAGRNLRSVWQIPTEPNSYAHYATYPRRLVEPCIKAGTSERGACAVCGAPWVRVVEKQKGEAPASKGSFFTRGKTAKPRAGMGLGERTAAIRSIGWRPSCNCPGLDGDGPWADLGAHPDGEANWPTVPCVVLDPFNGSGTTGVVALELGRSYIGIDLNEKDCEHTRKRLEAVAPLFAEAAAG